MSRKQKHSHSNKAEIDVVITTGGRFDMLEKCLDALYREAEKVPLSIYLIDNASPAEEYRMNSELFAKREGNKVVDFKVKHYTQSTGFPASNNEGARMGSAPLIMFLNDDVELQEGAVEKVVTNFLDSSIGILGIKLLFPENSTSPIRPAGKVQHVGMALNIRGEPVHPLVGWSANHPKANISRDVVCVTGACLTIRRTLFNQLGGFDTMFGMGTFEDVDLCFKARMAGQRVVVNVDAQGYHYVGATQEKKRIGFPQQQNRMIFQSKWQNTPLLTWSDWEFL